MNRLPEKFITPIGKVLRKLSLVKLPQIYSELKGDMCFVGHRPALCKQKVQFDEYYLHHRSFGFDLRILGLTIIRVVRRSGVTH